MLKDILSTLLLFFRINRQSLLPKKKDSALIIIGIVYVIFLITTFNSIWYVADNAIDSINNLLNIRYGIEDIAPLNSLLIINLQVTLRIMLLIGVLGILKYVFVFFGSPLIYIVISQLLKHNRSSSDFKQHVLASLYIVYFHGKWDIVYFTFLFFISFIPIIGVGMVIVLIILQCYYVGQILILLMYRMMYCPKLKIATIQKVSQKTNGLSIGLGVGFFLLHWIPLLGLYLAPVHTFINSAITVKTKIHEHE